MIRKMITAVFALILSVSLSWLASIGWQERVSSMDNAEAGHIAGASAYSVLANASRKDRADAVESIQANAYTDPEIDALKGVDIDALREINCDVIGWIRIPDTNIDYPLLRGDDNEYYLKHNWKHEPNAAGAIFIEQENAPNLSDFNTIIYGHNMRSGSMFGSLKEYGSQDYWKAHPYIYILHDNGVSRYDIFAAHKVKTGTITYAMQLKTAQLRAEFIGYALDNSQVHTAIRPSVEDRILTLSTCTDDAAFRWVVQGVLNEEQSYYEDVS